MRRLGCALSIAFSFSALVACSDDDPEEPDISLFHPVEAGTINDASAPDASLGGDAAASIDAASSADSGPIADAAPKLDATSDAAIASDAAPAADAGDAAASDAALSTDAAVDAASAEGGTPSDAGLHPDGSVATPGPAQSRSVTVGGAERTFQLYIPKSADKTKPMPFVSVHHGFTMSGKIMEDISTWKKIAEREVFVVAFPDGGDPLGPWNVGENVCDIGALVAGSSSQDDFGFVKAMVDAANAMQPIDRAHVFVGGFSMGGYFANNVGCKGRDFVRAISAHSGGTYAGDCPGKPVPVLLIHGDADGLIPYDCAKDARGYWVTRNGCSAQVGSAETIKNGSCDWNQGCPIGQELGMCTMNGMDHGWAGAPTTGPGAWLTAPLRDDNLGFGGGDQYEDAAELMWKFFKKYL
jgi:polyhydroxybutyrate depolymerase